MLADIDRNALGAKIRSGREGMKMTQEQLAELIGVSTQYIGNLERGKACPSIQMFVSLCYSLYIDPNELLIDSLPEESFASMRPYKLRSGDSIYAGAFIGLLETWWARSGVEDFDAFCRMPIDELPLSCFMDLVEDSSPFLSL